MQPAEGLRYVMIGTFITSEGESLKKGTSRPGLGSPAQLTWRVYAQEDKTM
jgi:hypothetical protein